MAIEVEVGCRKQHFHGTLCVFANNCENAKRNIKLLPWKERWNAEREFWYLIAGLVVGSRSVGRSVSKVVRFQFYMLMISQRERATTLHSNKLILGEANRPRTTQYVADEDDVMWWSTECNFDVLWSMNEKYKVLCTELWHGFHIFFISLLHFNLPASPPPTHRSIIDKNITVGDNESIDQETRWDIPINYQEITKCYRKASKLDRRTE